MLEMEAAVEMGIALAPRQPEMHKPVAQLPVNFTEQHPFNMSSFLV